MSIGLYSLGMTLYKPAGNWINSKLLTTVVDEMQLVAWRYFPVRLPVCLYVCLLSMLADPGQR